MTDTRALKDSIANSNLPDDLRNLILTVPDSIGEDEFIAKFMEWRKLARLKDGEKT